MDLVLGEPPVGLRRPVLLAGFGGWGDAGSAATIALRHLLSENGVPATAMLNPSACYDFTVARPYTAHRADGWSLEYPKVVFHPLPLAGADRDLLLLHGPEPHFHWPELAPAVIGYARDAGVELLVTLGAYVGAVSHRTAPVVRRTLDAQLGQQLAGLEIGDTDYEGPTAFVTALLHAATAAAIPAASLWVATPPYLQAGNPLAAHALLDAARRFTGLPLATEPLRTAAETFLREVEAALQEHPELAEQLQEMLDEVAEDADEEGASAARWAVPDPDRPPPDAPPGLPTGKSLVEAVERYLRQARGDQGSDG